MNRLEQLQTALKEKNPDNFIVVGSDPLLHNVARVPTNLIELDIALGGGIPVGRITMVHGPKSSGKSTLCELIVASFQKHCRKCWKPACSCKFEEGDSKTPTTLWVDMEGCYMSIHAAEVGVNTEYLLVERPGSGEAAADSIQASLESGLCDLIVVDSLALMTPLKEVERSMSESNFQMGSKAKLITEFLTKLQMVLNRSLQLRGVSPTVLLINQERTKISTFGPPSFDKINPGGEAQHFSTSVEIKLISGKVTLEKDQQRNVTGVSCAEAFFKIHKSKVYTPEFTGRYRIWVAADGNHKYGETDEVDKVAKLALQEEIVKKGANKLTYEKHTFKTQKEFREALQTDYTLLASVRQALLDKLVATPASAKLALLKVDADEPTRNPLEDKSYQGDAHAAADATSGEN